MLIDESRTSEGTAELTSIQGLLEALRMKLNRLFRSHEEVERDDPNSLPSPPSLPLPLPPLLLEEEEEELVMARS
jgi:hypothetical protein